ncbi:Flavonol reductase/cinnamoyl-CoA reductase [Ceraceosorus bombacis]|uniref:Flavonol reductase/cinnamoyl-CoA reductase n=1 Tax=Ceraceosorus bombacis TaxID=401625 RepID=A0A0P1BD23_9BASI|nr:Flavonol reductase/cinnamoyl-CoA reductase [Ceraceosorus bombacis]
MTDKTVCVSGVTGYVGSWVALTFLQHGWHVRGTVRSQQKRASLLATSAQLKAYSDAGKLTLWTVEDVITGDFSEALQGCIAFAHTASPFALRGSNNERDFLKPALEGTRNAIQAAHKSGTVRNFVVTSSFAAMMDGDDMFPFNARRYTEHDWNPATYEFAAQSDVPLIGYVTSKALAERFCWQYRKDNNLEGKMNIGALCPPMILGPFFHITDSSKLGESLFQMRRVITAADDSADVPPQAFPVFVDVRDVALAHVRCVERNVNSRYLIAKGTFSNQFVVDQVHEHFPSEAIKYKLPRGKKGEYADDDPKICMLEHDKSQRELGVEYTYTREETFYETIRDIFEHL